MGRLLLDQLARSSTIKVIDQQNGIGVWMLELIPDLPTFPETIHWNCIGAYTQKNSGHVSAEKYGFQNDLLVQGHGPGGKLTDLVKWQTRPGTPAGLPGRTWSVCRWSYCHYPGHTRLFRPIIKKHGMADHSETSDLISLDDLDL